MTELLVASYPRSGSGRADAPGSALGAACANGACVGGGDAYVVRVAMKAGKGLVQWAAGGAVWRGGGTLAQ
jgi:hypothetical protein